MNSFPLIFLIFFFLSLYNAILIESKVNHLGSLLHVTVLHRHGDRSPVHVNPNSIDKWHAMALSPGSLTAVGVDQMKFVGSELQSLYGKSSKYSSDQLLPAAPLNANSRLSFYIRSTAVERCLLSAESVLSGLYPLADSPHESALFLPVQSFPESADRLLQPTDKCPSHVITLESDYELFDVAVADPIWNFSEQFLTNLTQLTGWDTSQRRISWILSTVADNLICERSHGLNSTWPDWFSDRADSIESFTRWMWFYRFRTVRGDVRGSVGGILLQDWLQTAVWQREPLEKLRIYSAHDSTIAAMMSSLLRLEADSVWTLPPYASLVAIELREKTVDTKKIEFLNIWFGYPKSQLRNGTIHFEFIKENIQFPCPNDTMHDPIDPWNAQFAPQCSVTQFQRYVESLTRPLSGPISTSSWSSSSPTYPLHDGCCFRDKNFLAQCPPSAAYSNSSESCKLYRRTCPGIACGSGRLLNYQSLECTEIPVPVPISPTKGGASSGEELFVPFPILSDFGIELRALSILVCLSTLFGILIGCFTYHNRQSGTINQINSTVASDHIAPSNSDLHEVNEEKSSTSSIINSTVSQHQIQSNSSKNSASAATASQKSTRTNGSRKNVIKQ